jgi:hypothetical protein
LFEFTVLQTLAHPFILPISRHIHDSRGYHVLLSEWLPLPTLEAKIASKELEPEQIISIFTMICLAVEQTHA